jgi:hypothetical protein
MGQLAHFAVLSWAPDQYDYELGRFTVPKLYLFKQQDDRDDFQQQLFDTDPSLFLQAYKFTTPVKIHAKP